MAYLVMYRYTPLGSRLLDVYPRVVTVASIHKRFAPNTTAWIVTYGGAATFGAMFAAEFDSMESFLRVGHQFEQSPDLQELIRDDMGDPVLASTVQRSGGIVLSSLRPSADPSVPRAAYLQTLRPEPAVVQTVMEWEPPAAAADLYTAQTMLSLHGTAPASLISLLVAPDRDALGRGLDAVLADPAQVQLMNEQAAYRFGAVILEELLLP